MKWIVTANTNDCCVYEYNARTLKLLREITHPENKLQTKEWVSDKPGHYKTYTGNGTYAPRSEPTKMAVENFAKEVADMLNKESKNHTYDALVIIMPDQIGGLVFKNLRNDVKAVIKNIIHKNIMNLDKKALASYVWKNTLPAWSSVSYRQMAH